MYIDFDIENTLYIKCRVFIKSDYLMCLEPRSVIATPSLQRGHSSGLYVGTSRLSKACTFSFGTPNSALPPERLTRRPTPTISPPDWLTTLTTSCTEPPVVTMSSTMSTRVHG